MATTGSSSTVARDWKSIDNFSAARSRQRKSGSIPPVGRSIGKGEKRGSEISSVEDRGGDIARIVAKIEGGMNRGEDGPVLTKDRRGTAYRANETSGRGRRDFLLERRRVASTSGRGNYFNVGRVGRGIQCVGGPARSSLRPRNFDPRRGSLHRPRRSNVEGTTTARACACMCTCRQASASHNLRLYIDARYYAHRPRVHPFDDHKPRLGDAAVKRKVETRTHTRSRHRAYTRWHDPIRAPF